jgi:hypothetical protein
MEGLENTIVYILAGITISIGSYIAYKVANKVLYPKMCRLLLLWRTKRILNRNRLLAVYVTPFDLSYSLKRELEKDPLDEIRKVFKEVHGMKSIIDDKPVLRYLLDVVTTGIIVAEKAHELKYVTTLMEYTNNIAGHACPMYARLQELNSLILTKIKLSPEAIRMLIVEMERVNVLA